MRESLLDLLSDDLPPVLPRYKGVVVQSFYLPMSDGVRVAVDVLLPLNRKDEERLPTVMAMTRYWRSFKIRFQDRPNRAPVSANVELWDYLIMRGIAVVAVDARGSGASFGHHPYPWSPLELSDYAEVAAWAAQQPWSNGKIGSTGYSYEGSTAQFLPAVAGLEVKAILSQQMEFDPYTDVALPGGIFNEAFIRVWSDSNYRQDNNKPATFFPFVAKLVVTGVRPVDGDKDGAVLRQAIAAHAENPSVYKAMSGVTYRDDQYLPGVTVDDFAVYRRREQIEASGALLFNWGSWRDGTTAESVLSRFNTLSNPQVAVIGASNHIGAQNADPFAARGTKPSPTLAEQREIQARYFARFLADQPAPTSRKRLLYYTMGSGQWRETEVWPPRDVHSKNWYLQPGRGLAESASASGGTDHYTVDFTATTGKKNRWYTALVNPVDYGNRAREDAKLLTYTSAPLTADLTLTGQPIMELALASTHPDGAVYVYLEAVDERGKVYHLTDGQLRLIFRPIAAETPYWVGGVPRNFTRAEAEPFPLGEVVPVRIDLRPLSVLIRAGMRLRLAVAGHDAETFARLPAEGTPTLTVDYGRSWLELPVQG
ncbi:MAG: CocE/NonD family hydrolase [Anaerolineae bacterium]|jgi:hypothetical protein|nr:CocE/NonD family hydrolase [Anaerolineae bacterium]